MTEHKINLCLGVIADEGKSGMGELEHSLCKSVRCFPGLSRVASFEFTVPYLYTPGP